ncbi:MAG: GNAT family N-acetyltransferase, partial [Vicinamibacteria bacterium]
MKLMVKPVTPARWADVEAVFAARGCSVARHCWCMYYRRSGAAAPLRKGQRRADANRAGLK